MASYVYVDNSNVWIEGMHIAAVNAGYASTLDEAQAENICDNSWCYDFGKLLHFAGGPDSQIARAKLFGSKPPLNDSLWNAAKKNGFEVVTEERSYFTNKEKKIDSGICTAIMEDSYEAMIHSLPIFPVHSEKVNHSMIHFSGKRSIGRSGGCF